LFEIVILFKFQSVRSTLFPSFNIMLKLLYHEDSRDVNLNIFLPKIQLDFPESVIKPTHKDFTQQQQKVA
jgi:hypothetical protein